MRLTIFSRAHQHLPLYVFPSMYSPIDSSHIGYVLLFLQPRCNTEGIVYAEREVGRIRVDDGGREKSGSFGPT